MVQEHSHEAYRLEPAYVAHLLVWLADGDAEEVPAAGGGLAVGELDVAGFLNVHDVVLAYNHAVRPEVYDILVVVFRFTERVVSVDVFYVGVGRSRGHVFFVTVAVNGRVTLGIVEKLVAVVDFDIIIVVERRAIVAEIVARGVGGGHQVGLRLSPKAVGNNNPF